MAKHLVEISSPAHAYLHPSRALSIGQASVRSAASRGQLEGTLAQASAFIYGVRCQLATTRPAESRAVIATGCVKRWHTDGP